MKELVDFLDKNQNLERLLIIAPSQLRLPIIKTISRRTNIFNYSYKTPEEVIQDASFTIHPSAFFQLSKTKQNTHENANEIIKGLHHCYFAQARESEFIYHEGLIPYLIDRQLLTVTPNNSSYYQQLQIIIVGTLPDGLLVKALARLGVTYQVILASEVVEQKYLLHYQDYKQELEDVVRYALSLVDQGVDINKIRLHCCKSSYLPYLVLLLKKSKVPFIYSYSTPLIKLPFVAKMLEELDKCPGDIIWVDDYLEQHQHEVDKQTFDTVQELIDTHRMIIMQCDYSDLKVMLKFLFSKKISNNYYNHGICLSTNNFVSNYYEYLFVIGATEGNFEVLESEDFLIPDALKEKYQLETSIQANERNRKLLTNLLHSPKQLIVSYSSRTLDGQGIVSTLITSSFKDCFLSSLPQPNIPASSNFPYYFQIAAIRSLDNLRLFNIIDEQTKFYFHKFNNFAKSYLTYDNQANTISATNLSQLITKRPNLSATALAIFYRCNFNFLLDHLLQLNPAAESFNLAIGNCLHKILEESVQDKLGINQIINNSVRSLYPGNSARDTYFFNRALKIFKQFAFEVLAIHNLSNYKLYAVEKTLDFNLNSKLGLKFIAKIDKIMSLGDCYAVIDYKSGKVELPDDLAKFGLNVQLYYYAYAIKEFFNIAPEQIKALYYQSLKATALDEEVQFPLFGLTDKEELSNINPDFATKPFVCGIKKGELASKHQLKNQSEIISLADSLVRTAVATIESGRFIINPKVLKETNLSCKMCCNRDICYYKPDDLFTIGADEDGTNMD